MLALQTGIVRQRSDSIGDPNKSSLLADLIQAVGISTQEPDAGDQDTYQEAAAKGKHPTLDCYKS